MKHLFIILVLLSSFKGYSQEVVDVSFEGNLNKATFAVIIGTFLPDIEILTGVDLYRMTYTTIGSDNLPDTASGLLILPDTISGPLPIINYQHGTTDGPNAVPSNQNGQEYLLAAAFSTLGFISFAPDYIGLGTSRGFHPYVDPDTEARAMIDMLSATKSFLDAESIVYTDQLFITGYSQGGHAAMSAHRYIQEQLSNELTVTASLPMSGPYDISGVMLDIAFSDEEFFFPSYLVYSTLSLWTINPDLFESLADPFRPEFIDVIRPFAESGDGLGALNVQLLTILEREFGGSFPGFIFNEDFLNSIRTEPDHPFNVAIRAYDVYDWKPEAPMLILYCEGDDQVPFRNSIIADSVMQENNAFDVTSMNVEMDTPLDHSQCIVPALQTGVPWLLSFVDHTVPTRNILLDSDLLITYPNPTDDIVHVSYDDIQVDHIAIIDITGQLIWQKVDPEKTEQINLSSHSAGLYVIRATTENQVILTKIIKE